MTEDLDDKVISELVLDLTAQAVFVVDNKGICTYANAACLKLLGEVELDDMRGKDMHRVLHGAPNGDTLCVPQDCVINAALKNSGRLQLENVLLSHRNGFSRAAAYISEPLYRKNTKIGSVVTLVLQNGQLPGTQQISGRDKRLRSQQAAMLSLAKYHSIVDGDLESVLCAAVETSAKTLKVERVSVWIFGDGHATINCIDLYTSSSGVHTSGMELTEKDFPHYFKALHENRVIVADVAHENPATREFAHDYFPLHGIFSMLDAPIWRGSEVIGVVCHEHVDCLRQWTPDEQNFASSVADMVSLSMELWHHKQARQALLESEARFSGIIKIAAEAIISVDENQRIVLFNQSAENIFGYSQEETLGKNLAMLLPDAVKQEHGEHIKKFGRSSAVTSRMGDGSALCGRRKNGEEFPTEATISKLTLGDNRTLFTVAMRDITDRLRKDDELRKYRAHLEDLVNDRTRELARVRDEALQASKAKSVFLANMSHELRTPLNSIMGFTGILIDEITGPVNEQQKKQLGIVYDSASHLLDLIKGVLDLSKIEAGKFEVNKTRFSVVPLLQELIDLMMPQTLKKELNLRLEAPDKPVFACTDRSKLRQILLNLISNAVKFTVNGNIIVRLRLKGNNAYFDIQDDGIGIPPDHMDRIFEAFYQDKDSQRSRELEGTGLGLAICKHFAELMGGNISVSSDATGTTFCVCQPNIVVEYAPEINREHNKAHVLPPRNRRVLLIDDDDRAVDLLVNYLEREGYETLAIDNTSDIVEIAREYKPFAITLDLLMPGRSGWSVLTELKTDPITAKIPVMIISILDEQKLGMTLGAIDYVQKPIDQQRLLSGLQALRVQGRDVLIVEDNERDMQFLCVLLQQTNYRVRIARSGSDGITEIERMCPDIILLDLMMPGMSGIEFIRYVKTNMRTREIPIIVISAQDLSQGEADYLREHAEEIMHKGSFSNSDILDLVGKTLVGWSR